MATVRYSSVTPTLLSAAQRHHAEVAAMVAAARRARLRERAAK